MLHPIRKVGQNLSQTILETRKKYIYKISLVSKDDEELVFQPRCPVCDKTLVIFDTSNSDGTSWLCCPDCKMMDDENGKPRTMLRSDAHFSVLVNTDLLDYQLFKSSNEKREFYINAICNQHSYHPLTFMMRADIQQIKEEHIAKLIAKYVKQSNQKKREDGSYSEEDRKYLDEFDHAICNEIYKLERDEEDKRKGFMMDMTKNKGTYYRWSGKLKKPSKDLLRLQYNAKFILRACTKDKSYFFGRYTLHCNLAGCKQFSTVCDGPCEELNSNLLLKNLMNIPTQTLPRDAEKDLIYADNCIPYEMIKEMGWENRVHPQEMELAIKLYKDGYSTHVIPGETKQMATKSGINATTLKFLQDDDDDEEEEVDPKKKKLN